MWDDLVYEWQLGTYQLGLRATPPIVMPDDPSAALTAEALNDENTLTIPNMLGSAVSQSANQITSAALPWTIIIVGVVGLFLFLDLKGGK